MNEFVPWWVGALGLAATALGFVAVIGRPLGVSGLLGTVLSPTAKKSESTLERMSEAELEQALLAATRAQFGDAAVEEAQKQEEEQKQKKKTPAPSLGWSQSLLFLLGVVGGGTIFWLVSGTPAIEVVPAGLFARLYGSAAFPALFFGGVLVGVGTAMAGGCTSGHGLVGCGRLQVPSLISTACFFGTGIALALLVDALVLS